MMERRAARTAALRASQSESESSIEAPAAIVTPLMSPAFGE